MDKKKSRGYVAVFGSLRGFLLTSRQPRETPPSPRLENESACSIRGNLLRVFLVSAASHTPPAIAANKRSKHLYLHTIPPPPETANRE